MSEPRTAGAPDGRIWPAAPTTPAQAAGQPPARSKGRPSTGCCPICSPCWGSAPGLTGMRFGSRWPLRRRRHRDRRRRRHRRAGRPDRPAPPRHLALRGGIRQPRRLPVLRRGALPSCSTCGRCRLYGGLGFIPSLMFAVCMALRLARFNAALDATPVADLYRRLLHRSAGPGRRAARALFPIFVGLEARAVRCCPGFLTLAHSTPPSWRWC